MLAAEGDGAWIGTPLLATHEAVEVAESYKKCIVESDGQDTIFTRVFDIMYNLQFPEGIAGRARVNRVTREWHGREEEVRQRREELAAQNPMRSPLERDPEVHPIWMGQSAGSVHGVKSVAEVIGQFCDGAERLLRERSRTLVPVDSPHRGDAAPWEDKAMTRARADARLWHPWLRITIASCA